MILTAVIFGLVVVLSNLFLLFGIRRAISSEKRALLVALRSLSESSYAQEQVAKFIDTMAGTFGTHIAASLKATFMGVQSVEAKNQARVEGAITKDLISQSSPLAGIILDKFPAVGKLMNKNPGLLPMVMQYLGKGKQPDGGDDGEVLTNLIDSY